MWNRPVTALLRIKLKSGRWIGGVFEKTDAGGKSDAQMEKDGTPTVIDRGLLIRGSEVEYLDIKEY
jgi:hypothetical protein